MDSPENCIFCFHLHRLVQICIKTTEISQNNTPQNDRKNTKKWQKKKVQNGQKWVKNGQEKKGTKKDISIMESKRHQNDPEMMPKRCRNEPQVTQNDPGSTQKWSKITPKWPHSVPKGRFMGTKRAQKRPKMSKNVGNDKKMLKCHLDLHQSAEKHAKSIHPPTCCTLL